MPDAQRFIEIKLIPIGNYTIYQSITEKVYLSILELKMDRFWAFETSDGLINKNADICMYLALLGTNQMCKWQSKYWLIYLDELGRS